ncbi:hypothetical protein EGR_04016 [Echinococcus granulosus]|uniref:Uncharacterized protein n=1 Tax=Echinococcus granulosus TaxID=6210 RepID=W6UJF1_ECHGR|nr:hypothetical protein EGR_04016 [Echinococcus granulosus]EUB61168.1 hypothetical protein EGR_04016 [Echinococcus granulosus]
MSGTTSWSATREVEEELWRVYLIDFLIQVP